MATVSQEIAETIIRGDGHYADDERVQQVITYDNAFGGKSWAVLYAQDVAINRYAPSEYVRNPKVIWSAT